MKTFVVKTPSLILISLLLTSSLLLGACAGSSPNFSILPDSNHFKQSASTLNNKLDILWVVDNSGSMAPLQQNLTNNFNSFISSFSQKGYDFKISVTTSDAYLSESQFNNQPSLAKFRDGLGSTHTNVFTIIPTTLNLINTFVTNATQGQNGSGDERVFSSFRDALNSSQNSGFLRPDSFMAVIILSDEDDFSNPTRCEGCGSDHDYSQSGLDSVASYESYLDTLTGTSVGNRRYNVSAITVLDTTCRNSHAQQAGSTIIGTRYIQMANDTDGALGSICDASYSTALNQIQSHIAELSTQFYLSRIPNQATIQVIVNSATVVAGATNGWTYNSTNNSILFHGTAIPKNGDDIVVNFTPISVK